MSDKAVFKKTEAHNYNVPLYTIVEGKGIDLTADSLTIQFVRGSKVEDENILPKIDGVLVEQLLAVCIDHLKAVNVGELKNSYTDAAIDALEEAGLFLEARENKRKKENTLGTYKK